MFTPEVGLELAIEGKTYRVAAHPAAPWMPYGQEGRAAIVYRLEAETGEAVALKVFKERFRTPSLVGLKRKLEPFATLPGLTVCRREVLTPTRHRALLQRYPDLLYAVLMPWIEGPTWQEIVQTRQALTCEQSLTLAQSLLNVLVGMEEEGIAHCDLSGPNLLLPALAGGEGVELVDVEGIYAPGLIRPEEILSGSLGYAHVEALQGYWGVEADRFAGAVLLAEMLGWCDERVREAAWGESYFAPEEVQQESARYKLLIEVLKQYWGNEISALFHRAWQSHLLIETPTFGEWWLRLLEIMSVEAVNDTNSNVESSRKAQVITGSPDREDEIEGEKASWPAGPSDFANVSNVLSTTNHHSLFSFVKSNKWIVIGSFFFILLCGVVAFLTNVPVLFSPTPSVFPTRTLQPIAVSPSPSVVMTPTPTATMLPAAMSTPIPDVSAVISVSNADRLVALTRWGQGSIQQIAYSPDGMRLAVATSIGVYIYDAQTMTPQQFLDAHSRVLDIAFSPNGKTLAAGCRDHVIRLWRIDDGILVQTFRGHSRAVDNVAFLPHGDKLLSSSSGDKTSRIWQITDGTLLYTIENDAVDLALSPDGQIFASGTEEGDIDLWDIADGSLLSKIKGYNQEITSLAFSSDKTLASGFSNGVIRVWRISDGRLLLKLNCAKRISDLAFSSDGTLLVAGSADGKVCLWNTSDGALLYTLQDNMQEIRGVTFSPDNSQIATCSLDGTVRLWRVSDGRLYMLHTLDGHTDKIWEIAFSPDGKTIASASLDHTVRLWRPHNGQIIQTLVGTDKILSVDFSPDALNLATGADNGQIRIWRSANGDLLQTFTAHHGRINRIVFAPSGEEFASGSADKTVRVWDATEERLIRTLRGHMNQVLGLAYSPSGEVLASGSQDGTIRLWRVSEGQLLHTLEGHTDAVRDVAFSPNGDLIASCSWDHTIRIWQVSDGSLLKQFDDRTGVVSIAFSPDGKILASGGWNAQVMLWKVDDGTLLATLSGHTDTITSLAFSPDGKLLLSGSADATIRMWGIQP